MTTVLIVEDDTAFRTTIGRDLTEQGFTVSLAQNAEEATAILAEQLIEILLTDLRMPGADGNDLLDRVRALSPRTRAILMSGFANARDYQRAIECGAVRVLCKPFTSGELLQAIRQAIDCETGFRGSIHGLSLVDLLQMFHFARRSLAIVVDGWAPGRVFLREGRIIHAVCREQVGVAALRSILAMPAGSLRTMVLPEDAPQTISGDFDELLLDTLRSVDEMVAGRPEEELADFDDPTGRSPDAQDSVPRQVPRGADPNAEDARAARTRVEVFFERLRRLDGYSAACLVDGDSGLVLGADGNVIGLDVHAAAAGYAEVYRAERRVLADLTPDDGLEDILVTLSGHYHVLHALRGQPALFIHVVLERRPGNLGQVRFALAAAEAAHG